MKVKLICSTLFLLFFTVISSQEKAAYQEPPREILELALAKPAPRILIDDAKKHMILLYRNSYKTIAELSEKEMRLAGLRINPKTNVSSRINYYNDIKVSAVGEETPKEVNGLPDTVKFANLLWSPDQKHIAFSMLVDEGLELWILNVKEAEATKLTHANLNGNIGIPYKWFKDSSALLVKMLPKDQKSLIDSGLIVPKGPTVSVSDGEKAQNRTYQDLLKNKNDEANFKSLASAELYEIQLNGNQKLWQKEAMYQSFDFSPDGTYVLTSEIKEPFSYLVPYRRFPHEYNLYTKYGSFVKNIESTPLLEVLPKGFMAAPTGKRRITWIPNKKLL